MRSILLLGNNHSYSGKRGRKMRSNRSCHSTKKKKEIKANRHSLWLGSSLGWWFVNSTFYVYSISSLISLLFSIGNRHGEYLLFLENEKKKTKRNQSMGKPGSWFWKWQLFNFTDLLVLLLKCRQHYDTKTMFDKFTSAASPICGQLSDTRIPPAFHSAMPQSVAFLYRLL